MDMRSEVGEGTTFDVYLPCSDRVPQLEQAIEALPNGTARPS